VYVVVIFSANRTEDRGFESRLGERFLGLQIFNGQCDHIGKNFAIWRKGVSGIIKKDEKCIFRGSIRLLILHKVSTKYIRAEIFSQVELNFGRFGTNFVIFLNISGRTLSFPALSVSEYRYIGEISGAM
jgi:hypothetical protein